MMRAVSLLAVLGLPLVQAQTCDMLQGLHNEAVRRQKADYDDAPFFKPEENAKHTPRIEITGTVARVFVGGPNDVHPIHPMDAGALHYIDTIYVMDQTGTVIAGGMFGPLSGAPPMLEFDVPAGTTSMTPYEHCNKHGLFYGETVPVTETTGQPAPCAPSTCFEVASSDQICQQLDLLRQDWERRAGGETQRSSLKHRPFAVEDRGRVHISVGEGTITGDAALIHPQNFADEVDIHYIEGVWAVDQDNTVIAMSYFGSKADPLPTLEFDIPAYVTTITPYIFCNKHGLHIGDPINVTSASSSVLPNCAFKQCLPTPEDPTSCSQLESIRAWWDRRQVLDHNTRAAFYGSSSHHVPYVTLSKQGDATMADLVVGDEAKYHPQSLEGHHYMEAFWLLDQNGRVVNAMHMGPSAPVPVRATFEVPRGVSQVTPYTFCNKHGLFRGPTVFLNRPATGSPLCGLSQCGEDFVGMDAQGTCTQLEEYKADYLRRHGAAPIHDPENQAKHTPMVVMDKGRARVTVGTGTVTGDETKIHLQYNVENSLDIHYIESLWAEDQDGRVIAFALLSPVSPGVLDFDVPEGVTSITGYIYCNIHGLFQSDTLTGVEGVAGVKRSCGLATCAAKPSSMMAPCDSLGALHAAYERRHLFDYETRAAYHDPSNKHTPVAELSTTAGQLRTIVRLTDGNGVFHPQSADGPHYIEAIFLVDQNGVAFAGSQLGPTYGDLPTMEAVIPTGVTQVTPYQFCNKHGLWRGVTTYVKGSGPRTCGFSTCGTDAKGMVDGRCVMYDAIHAEMERRQNGPVTYDKVNQAKHTPVLTIANGRATIKTGMGNLDGDESKIHGQFDALNGVKSHFIEAMYAMDQNGTIVAAGWLSPLVSPATFTFDVPKGVTTLTPYIYCNIHGWFRGDAVPFTGTSKAEYSCSMGTCWPEAHGFATCDIMQSIPAQFIRQQRYEFNTEEAQHEPVDVTGVGLGKHTPHLIIDGNIGRVYLGPEATGRHPMVVDHYIDTLWVQDQSGAVIAMNRLGPFGGPALLEFEIPFGSSVLTPYGHCNKHGYHRGTSKYFTGIANVQGLLCAPAGCHSVALTEQTCDTYTAFRDDYIRRAGPTGIVYDIANQAKHTPMATPQGGKVRITVGTGTVNGDESKIHLQYNALNPETVHFIENIWAEDQNGEVVSMGQFGPLDNPAVLEFDVPAGVTSVTPYHYCNIHGLFRGDAIQVTPGSAKRTCGIEPCYATGRSDNRRVDSSGGGGGPTLSPAPRITPGPPTPSPVSLCTPSTVVDPQTGELFTCVTVFGKQAPNLHWTINGSKVVFGIESSGAGWVGLSFPEDASLMVPADGVIGWIGANGEADVQPYRLTDQNPRGVNVDAAVRDKIGLESAELIASGGKQLLRVERRTCVGETGACRPIDPTGQAPINVAQHPSVLKIEAHPTDAMAGLMLSLARGEAQVEVIDIAKRQTKRRLHGAVMMAAWLYCAPVGIFFKRYGKPVFGIGMSTSHTFVGQGGFLLHIIPVLCAVALAFVGFDIALQYWWTWGKTGDRVAYSHSEIGTTIFLLVIIQPTVGILGALLAPQKDHALRPAFNFIHGWTGRGLQVLSCVQCFTGLRNLKDMHAEYEDLQVVAFFGLAFFIGVFINSEIMKLGYRTQRTRFLGGDQAEVMLDFIGAETVASHDKWEDCWVTINGFAYDVTEWLVRHPGGGSMIYEWAGGDATASFEGYRHSVQARNLMAAYRVAEVETVRVQNSVELSEEITSALVLFDLDEATELVNDGQKKDLPNGLVVAFTSLIGNLKSYKQFLPQSLTGADEADDSDKNDEVGSQTSSAKGGRRETIATKNSGATLKSRGSIASHRTGMTGRSKATTVKGNKEAQNHLKEQRQRMLKDRMIQTFKPRQCSLAVVNANGGMQTCKKLGGSQFAKILKSHIGFLLEHTKKVMGIVDSFQGDRMTVGFNTAGNSAQHKTLSCLYAYAVTRGRDTDPILQGDKVFSKKQGEERASTDPLSEKEEHLLSDITCAAGSMMSFVGNSGCDGMLRFTVYSSLYGFVAALERLAGAWGVKTIVDEAVVTEAAAQMDTKILARVYWAKAGIKSKVSTLENRIEVDEDEWMYQLQKAAEKCLWTNYNKAMDLYLDGENDECVKLLDQSMSSPPEIDGASPEDLENLSAQLGKLRTLITTSAIAPYVEIGDVSVAPSVAEPIACTFPDVRARGSALFMPPHLRES